MRAGTVKGAVFVVCAAWRCLGVVPCAVPSSEELDHPTAETKRPRGPTVRCNPLRVHETKGNRALSTKLVFFLIQAHTPTVRRSF